MTDAHLADKNVRRRAVSLPEPGGYLQWSEHNLATASVECARPGLETGDLEYLVEYARRVAFKFVQHGITA